MFKNTQNVVKTKTKTNTNTKSKAKTSAAAGEYLISKKDVPFVVTESFRRIVANIGFGIPKKEGKGKIFCVSSAVPGEGKSTVTVNLAISSAAAGTKTVLVDCDMRKPHVSRFFNLKGRGLVDYLSGTAKYEDILVKDVQPNLDVIPCFKTSPNPMALLTDAAFSELLDKLVVEYETVIIDTPPVTVVADACFIGPKTDGVVMVVRQMESDHKTLQQALGALQMSNCNVIGFALNAFLISKSGRYGSYRYRYDKYGYGHRGGGDDGSK